MCWELNEHLGGNSSFPLVWPCAVLSHVPAHHSPCTSPGNMQHSVKFVQLFTLISRRPTHPLTQPLQNVTTPMIAVAKAEIMF